MLSAPASHGNWPEVSQMLATPGRTLPPCSPLLQSWSAATSLWWQQLFLSGLSVVLEWWIEPKNLNVKRCDKQERKHMTTIDNNLPLCLEKTAFFYSLDHLSWVDYLYLDLGVDQWKSWTCVSILVHYGVEEGGIRGILTQVPWGGIRRHMDLFVIHRGPWANHDTSYPRKTSNKYQ